MINCEEKQIKPEKPEKCNHELIAKEYLSQPYGTCVVCGQTLIGL